LKLEVLRLGGTALAINGTNTVTLRQLAGLPRLRQVLRQDVDIQHLDRALTLHPLSEA
jgi:hypothetical protein